MPLWSPSPDPAATTDLQSFTTPGNTTWVKPNNAAFVEVICVGGGGGGGSGNKGAAASTRPGGSGGGGGGVSRMVFPAADLPASVLLTVGASGTGAVTNSTDGTNGTNGNPGGASYFGNTGAGVDTDAKVEGSGGGGGLGGVNGTALGTSPVQGSGNYMSRVNFLAPAALGEWGAGASGAAAGGSASYAAPCGGGGGGVSSGNVEAAGGAGGRPGHQIGYTPAVAGAVHAAGNPGPAITGITIYTGMSGSGGGGQNATNNTNSGGAGTGPGAGGGGGGAGTSAVGNGGAGGAGAAGAVWVITYLATPGNADLAVTTETEVNLGAAPDAHRSGHVAITGLTNLVPGRHVQVIQAAGPYTGKGLRVDEVEMDQMQTTGKVRTSSIIDVYWQSQYRMRGNVKLLYGGSLGMVKDGGTSFPAPTAANQQFRRTDLGMDFWWDGFRWNCSCLHTATLRSDVALPATASFGARGEMTAIAGGSDLNLKSVYTVFNVAAGGTALGASHKWVGTGGGFAAGPTINIDSGASATWRTDTQALNQLAGTIQAGEFDITWTKTGTPGNLYVITTITYWIVAV